ncbi:MAG: hypothetical protein ABI026_07200 [Gemmatimonadaceae bacterium]
MLGAAVFTAALVFVSTRAPGPGLDPDSMAYMGAASSLVHEGKLRVPTAPWDRADSTSSLSLWPPGFSIAIALPVFLGASPVQSARWINVLAAAASAVVIMLLIADSLGAVAGAAGVLVVFATQAVFDVHISVLSEPLFIAVMLLVLATMIHARDRLLILGALATLAVMIRYAGACAPLAVVLWTLLDSRYDLGTRARRAAVVALIPTIAIVLWFARTASSPDRHSTPSLDLYGGWGATFAQARDTVAEWLAPVLQDGTAQRIVALAVAIALMVFIVTAARDTTDNRRRQMRYGGVSTLIAAVTLLSACYAAVVLGSRAFVGGTIPLDGRILAPLIVLIEIAGVVSVAYWWHAYHRPLRVIIVLAGIVWIGAAATVTVNDAVYAATEGSDFAGSDWRDSPLTSWVRAHGAGHPLYSNWPAALYFHGNRVARELPKATRPKDVAAFGEMLRRNGGYVIAFNEVSPDFVPPDSIARQTGLRRLASTADGDVWAAEPVAPTGAAARDSVFTAPAVATPQH